MLEACLSLPFVCISSFVITRLPELFVAIFLRLLRRSSRSFVVRERVDLLQLNFIGDIRSDLVSCSCSAVIVTRLCIYVDIVLVLRRIREGFFLQFARTFLKAFRLQKFAYHCIYCGMCALHNFQGDFPVVFHYTLSLRFSVSI